jgi:peptidyl-Asp metalloendopeptidase
MKWFKSISSRSALCALAGAAALITMTAAAQLPEPPGLVSRLPNVALTTLTLPQQAITDKSRAVAINHPLLRGERFFVSLPGDIAFEAIRDSQQDLGGGRFSWTGHATDEPDSTVVIGVSGAAVAGAFTYQGQLFKLEPRANGSHVLSEVQTTDPAPELEPVPVADTSSGAPVSTAVSGGTATSTVSVIDVLVVTTPAVRALYGAEGDDALAILSVAETNQAYSNSGMTTRLDLAGVYTTDYIESGDMLTDLNRLRATNDGFMDEVHSVRNVYGADVVSLIEDGAQYCGIAYRMVSLSTSFAPHAFSVVSHACATGYYSFAHEIGHNQGAHHDIANAGGAATIYPYAHGYQDPNGAFRTVMAYDCPVGCPRIQHFSNPNVLYGGVPTGEPTYAADGLAIDQTAATVADFRAHVAEPPPGC